MRQRAGSGMSFVTPTGSGTTPADPGESAGHGPASGNPSLSLPPSSGESLAASPSVLTSADTSVSASGATSELTSMGASVAASTLASHSTQAPHGVNFPLSHWRRSWPHMPQGRTLYSPEEHSTPPMAPSPPHAGEIATLAKTIATATIRLHKTSAFIGTC